MMVTLAPPIAAAVRCIFRRAGEIILAGEQKERAYFSIDPLDPATQVAVDPIEIKVPLEHARPALLAGP
jgi:hypothetical protein